MHHTAVLPMKARKTVCSRGTKIAQCFATDPMEADVLPKDARRPAPQVHVVTAEEAAAKQFGIERVVLPLPGHEAVYPEHATAQARHQDFVRLLQSLPVAELAEAYQTVIRPTS